VCPRARSHGSGEIDERVRAFLGRPIEGDWPYLWLDATYVKVREAGRVVPVAVTIAVGVSSDGRREVLGMAVGASEAEPFWIEFLRSLARRGLRGVKLVISDAHEGLKAAIGRVLHATWQRCRVHFMRNALAHAGKGHRRIVSAWIGTAFAQDDAAAARQQWRIVADQRPPDTQPGRADAAGQRRVRRRVRPAGPPHPADGGRGRPARDHGRERTGATMTAAWRRCRPARSSPGPARMSAPGCADGRQAWVGSSEGTEAGSTS